MSTFSNRKRGPRRLGQPLFPIEDPEIVHAPTQPLADLTADLDAALADQSPVSHTPVGPQGLLIPAEVRAAYERARQSARSAPPLHQSYRRTPEPARNAQPIAGQKLPPSAQSGSTTGRPSATLHSRTTRPESASLSTGQAVPVSARHNRPSERPLPEPERAPVTTVVSHVPRFERQTAFVPVPAELTDELPLPPPTYRRPEPLTIADWFNQPLVLLAIAVTSIVVIGLWFGMAVASPFLSFQYARVNNGSVAASIASAAVTGPAPGDYRLRTAPSLSPTQIDRILQSYGSPATGTGEIWYRLGLEYNIDPAYALAFFIHESGAGTNPNWAGFKPDGSTTHNVGNIICAGYPTCYGRFRDYPNWEAGIADWYRLIDVEYIRGRGLQTVAEVIPIYAPSIENDVQGYINVVTRLVDQWRTGNIP